jgi:sigma-B regulation protein RsbU (phosphoserine phosphatase)
MPAPAEAETPAEPADAVRHVLVVDDSRGQRRLLARMLSGWGHVVREAGSGAEALELCRTGPVDLILSDWMMPGMSGLEFCRAFRALPRDSYGYFILLTSKTEKDAVAQGLEEGADDFLSKPVNPEELRARILAGERILRMERELQQKNRLVSETLARLQEVHDSLDRDLRQARQLQQSLVREGSRRFGPAQVSLLLRPSGHVGGDLVGFFPIGTDRVGLHAIDVSGHGVTSALLAARLAGLFSGAVPEQNIALMPAPGGGLQGRPPAEVAATMNRLMLEEIDTDHYCTLVYAELTPATGALRLVQAGHPHPLIQRASGEIEFLGTGGLPVGLVPDATYQDIDARLHPGDRLLVLSDGVTECEDTQGAELGEAGLHRLVTGLMGLRGPDFLNRLLELLARHCGSTEFRDDVSAVLAEFHSPEPER